jgi:hypothetical protein
MCAVGGYRLNCFAQLSAENTRGEVSVFLESVS